MQRPLSIVWFERCYLGSLVVAVLNTLLSWNTTIAKLTENPATAQFGPSFGSSTMMFSLVLVIVISLLLWFFTARKGSVVTKWIVTVFFVLGVLGVLLTVVKGTMLPGISGVLTVVVWVLDGIAVWQLFKPDAKVWFGETKA